MYRTMYHLPTYFFQDEGRLEEELASFRREWHEEIQRTANDSGSSRNSPTSELASQPSREGSPSPLLLARKNSVNAAQQLEEKVVPVKYACTIHVGTILDNQGMVP